MLSSYDSTSFELYDKWLRPGCHAAADLYNVAVSGSTFQSYFQEGSKLECDSKCMDPYSLECTKGGS